MRHHIDHVKHHEQMLKRSKKIMLALGVNMAMALVILALYALNLIGELTGRW